MWSVDYITTEDKIKGKIGRGEFHLWGKIESLKLLRTNDTAEKSNAVN